MFRIGIDLGGTNIAAGVVDDFGNLLRKSSVPTKADRAPGEIIEDIISLCYEVCEINNISIESVVSIGIAVPGGVDDASGQIIFTPNIPFSGINIVNLLSQEFENTRIGVINDANAALLAELIVGSAKGMQNAVMITIGTGIGGAIAINGKIISGANGAAGELGHIVIQRNGKQCACGRRGCFERYASATALIELTKQEISKCSDIGEYTEMSKAQQINARVAFDAYKLGDNAAKRVIDEYIDALTCGIISLINAFQPDVFVIGGGVSGEKEFLIDLIQPFIDKEDYARDYKKRSEIVTALCGNDAGIIGAAFA